MKTLAWCWLAMAASAFFWSNQWLLPSLAFIGSAGMALGFKLSQLSRAGNWSDAKLFFVGFMIVATAGLSVFLTKAIYAVMGN